MPAQVATRVLRHAASFWRHTVSRVRNVAHSTRRNVSFAALRLRTRLTGSSALDPDLGKYGKKVFSQNDEDGILEYLFFCLGSGTRFFVEIGVGPPWTPAGFLPVETVGLECNTRLLAERSGWRGVLLDGGEFPARVGVKREFITAENINQLLVKYDVPRDFDLFSLDVDGNDYWIWKALEFTPRVAILEYNASLPADASKTIEYDPNFSWSERGFTKYYGASLLALYRLGLRKGYVLVYANGINAFFVRSDLVRDHAVFDYARLYRFREAHQPLRGDERWVDIE